MIPDEAAMREIVRTVWSTQLGLDLDPDPDRPIPIAGPSMTAAVHITGDFLGGVRLAAGLPLVRRAAAIMFARPEDRITADDARDTLGELANIVAGNIKALIDGTSSISLPTIVDGSDYTVSTVDLRASEELGFTLDREPLTVTVFEHTGD
ncbi:MAG: chemotaxis protein CheX [Holophagae bacterium]